MRRTKNYIVLCISLFALLGIGCDRVPKVKQYIVVSGSNYAWSARTKKYYSEIQEKVTKAMAHGWQPLGGVAIRNGIYQQAMVRYE